MTARSSAAFIFHFGCVYFLYLPPDRNVQFCRLSRCAGPSAESILMTPPLGSGPPPSVQDVHAVAAVQAAQFRHHVIHFDLFVRGQLVILLGQGVMDGADDAGLILLIHQELFAYPLDPGPAFDVLGVSFLMELLHAADLFGEVGDDPMVQLQGPLGGDGLAEGGNELIGEDAAPGQDGELLAVFLEEHDVLPDGGRHFAEVAVPFLIGERGEDIFLGAVHAVLLQVERLIPRCLGEFLQERGFIPRGADGPFDAVQHGLQHGGHGQVGVGVRVGGAQFKPGGEGIFHIADQAHQDGPVAGGDLQGLTQGGDDADGGFIAFFEPAEGVVALNDEGADHFIIMEQAHEGGVAEAGHEMVPAAVEEIDPAAVSEPEHDPDVDVLAGTGDAFHGFGQKGDLHALVAEHFLDDELGHDLIVGGLQGTVVAPVDLQLLHDALKGAFLIEAGFDAADFLMAHLRFQAVFAHDHEGPLQGGADIAPGPGPVLLLELLGNGQLFHIPFLLWRLDPEFQFRGGGDVDAGDVFRGDAEGGQGFGVLGDEPVHFAFEIGNGPFQDRPGIHGDFIMDQDTGDLDGGNGLPGLGIDVLHVPVDPPFDFGVDLHVDLGVVQGGDARQDDGGAVGLNAGPVEKGVHVLAENGNGDLFIGFMAHQVHAGHGHEFDLRMLIQDPEQAFLCLFLR